MSLSKKLLPPWLSLILSALCRWLTVVKCPELVSCLSVSNTLFIAVTCRKGPGRGNPFALQLKLRHEKFSSVFLLFQRLLFQVQGLCCEVLESAVVLGLVELGPWNLRNGFCKSDMILHLTVHVALGQYHFRLRWRWFSSKHLSYDTTNSATCSYAFLLPYVL